MVSVRPYCLAYEASLILAYFCFYPAHSADEAKLLLNNSIKKRRPPLLDGLRFLASERLAL